MNYPPARPDCIPVTNGDALAEFKRKLGVGCRGIGPPRQGSDLLGQLFACTVLIAHAPLCFKYTYNVALVGLITKDEADYRRSMDHCITWCSASCLEIRRMELYFMTVKIWLQSNLPQGRLDRLDILEIRSLLG